MSNKYLTKIRATNGHDKGKTIECDIYDIINAFGITNVGQIQAVKKILRGGRADKSWRQDIREGIQSLQRALEIDDGHNQYPEGQGDGDSGRSGQEGQSGEARGNMLNR